MRLNQMLRVAATVGAVTLLTVACRQAPEEPEAKPAAQAERVAPTTPVGADASAEAAKPAARETADAEAKPTRPAAADQAEAAAEPPPFEGRKLGIVHTANVVGELEPCG